MSRKDLFFVLAIFLAIALCLVSCGRGERRSPAQGKIVVVTTLFPLYDFARHIGGERADVTMLIPPGVEAHSYEPRPADLEKIHGADIFIFTGKIMEPWVDELLKGIDAKNLLVIDASRGIRLLRVTEEETEERVRQHDNEPAGLDPHIWLDFTNAVQMVDTISEGFIEKDPADGTFFRNNGEGYKKKLVTLDGQYRTTLSRCEGRTIIHAGHSAFGYLARRYHLQYISACPGFTPDSEPTPKRLAALIDTMKKHGSNTIYYEELITPRVAEVIAKETGGSLMMLHAGHNITKDQFVRGTDFIALMKENLMNLKMGLQCP